MHRHSPSMRSLLSQSQTPTPPRRAVGFFRFSTECSTGLWKWSHHSLPRFCQDLRNVQLTLPKIALSRMRRPRTIFLEMAVEFGPRPLDRILKEVAGNYIAPVTSRGATSSTGIKLSKL